MNAIEQITAYKCSDRQIFESEDIAQEHEMDVTVKKNVSDFIQSECWNNMQQDELIDILITNKAKLISILKGE